MNVLTVDGSTTAVALSYTFPNVTADHAIDVTFKAQAKKKKKKSACTMGEWAIADASRPAEAILIALLGLGLASIRKNSIRSKMEPRINANER